MSGLTHGEIEAAGLDDWRHLHGVLHARFVTGDFATGLRLVEAIGQAAEQADHHPDLDLRFTHLGVRLSSHDVKAVTERDLRLARTISGLAQAAGVTSRPERVQVLELALDTPDWTAVKPFWQAVLALDADPDAPDEVRDGSGTLPTLWFQHSGAEEPRQRFHLDIAVPPEVAAQRIAAALEAGGVLVSDAEAPAFTVLADADGNRVCVCTSLGRDG